MASSLQSLHEAWALAELLRARYGANALPHAVKEAHDHGDDKESSFIWQAVVECLSRVQAPA